MLLRVHNNHTVKICHLKITQKSLAIRPITVDISSFVTLLPSLTTIIKTLIDRVIFEFFS